MFQSRSADGDGRSLSESRGKCTADDEARVFRSNKLRAGIRNSLSFFALSEARCLYGDDQERSTSADTRGVSR